MKIIKDIVHEYIEIEDNIKEIIDTPSFQRLKKISQLTANHLFPSANHTRYEHSLGVMKLAMDFYDSIEDELKDLLKKENIINDKNLKTHLCYASLLHDIGHAPFSHLGENFYNKEDIKENLKNIIAEKKLFIDVNDLLNYGSKHEQMSCYCIIKNFYELLKKENIDFEFIFRIIIGYKYPDKEWYKNIIIEILNSSTLDVDKLDYLLRDNYMTGYPAPRIDVKRLLNSLYIDTDSKDLTFKAKGIASIQSVIDSRDALYLWVYNHHITVYTDYILKDIIKHCITIDRENLDYIDKIKWEDFFSCKAITEGLVTDSDVFSELRKIYVQKDDEKISKYSRKILPQIFERKFLKPIWKTLYEYVSFESDSLSDTKVKLRMYTDFIESTDAEKNRITVVKKLIKEFNLEVGDVFFIIRSNKFYHSKKNSTFYIYQNGVGNKLISELLPQKNYEKFNDVSFYIFCKDDIKEGLKKKFVEILFKNKYKE